MTSTPPVEPVPIPTTLSTRTASLSDLDAVTSAARLSDPQHSYRFPDASLYPAEQYYESRLIVAGENLAIAATCAYSIIVSEIPTDDDCRVRQVIAASVWRMPGTHAKREESKREADSKFEISVPFTVLLRDEMKVKQS